MGYILLLIIGCVAVSAMPHSLTDLATEKKLEVQHAGEPIKSEIEDSVGVLSNGAKDGGDKGGKEDKTDSKNNEGSDAKKATDAKDGDKEKAAAATADTEAKTKATTAGKDGAKEKDAVAKAAEIAGAMKDEGPKGVVAAIRANLASDAAVPEAGKAIAANVGESDELVGRGRILGQLG